MSFSESKGAPEKTFRIQVAIPNTLRLDYEIAAEDESRAVQIMRQRFVGKSPNEILNALLEDPDTLVPVFYALAEPIIDAGMDAIEIKAADGPNPAREALLRKARMYRASQVSLESI